MSFKSHITSMPLRHWRSKYIYPPSIIYAWLREQPCFIHNTNLDIRRAIRSAAEFCSSYRYINRNYYNGEKRKFIIGERHDFGFVNQEDFVIVERFCDTSFTFAALELKFDCPYCGGDKTPFNELLGKSWFITTTRDYHETIICHKCRNTDFASVKESINEILTMIKTIQKEARDDNINNGRPKKNSLPGSGGTSFREDNKIGSENESLCSEKHYRHFESRNCCSGDEYGQISTCRS